jgi:LacI family transcriptional regulator
VVEKDTPNRDLRRWLREVAKPVGILVCTDEYAAQVVEACRAVGLHVPHEVAMVGVDNDDVYCELLNPPLTSIAHAAQRIGLEAARVLDRQMMGHGTRKGRSPRGGIFVPPARVVPRPSSATLMVADPIVARAVEMIRGQPTVGLTIAGMAATLGVPRWRLEKRFKQAIGHSVHEDIVRARLIEAMRLIQTTRLPLKVVAKRSGFRTVAYMTTIIGRRFGVPPARLRRVTGVECASDPAVGKAS